MPPAELGALLAPALSAGLFGGGPVPSDRFLALATENCQDKIEVLTEAAPLLARVLGYPLAETLAGGEADEILAGNFKVRPTAPQAHPFFFALASRALAALAPLCLSGPRSRSWVCVCALRRWPMRWWRPTRPATSRRAPSRTLTTAGRWHLLDRSLSLSLSLSCSLSLSRAPCPT